MPFVSSCNSSSGNDETCQSYQSLQGGRPHLAQDVQHFRGEAFLAAALSGTALWVALWNLLPRGQKGSRSEGSERALRVLSLVASKIQLDLVTIGYKEPAPLDCLHLQRD